MCVCGGYLFIYGTLALILGSTENRYKMQTQMSVGRLGNTDLLQRLYFTGIRGLEDPANCVFLTSTSRGHCLGFLAVSGIPRAEKNLSVKFVM